MSEVSKAGIRAVADDLDPGNVSAHGWAASASGPWSYGLGIPARRQMRQLNSMSLASGRSGYRAESAATYWEMSTVSSPPRATP